MTALLNAILKLKIWKDTHGQDLTEYALLGGFLAAASGAVLPNISSQRLQRDVVGGARSDPTALRPPQARSATSR
jgi:hypothetical protein